MGHKKYKLMGDVEVPYGHPPGLSEINFFSIDFYPLSDETCCKSQAILSE